MPGRPEHGVACLLDHTVRRRVWSELSAGHTPDEVRAAVELEERPA